ncbi:MAG: HAMP domain-containing histidine kinase [Clostridiales bacterium]|nr:HAMP domain-containing histidine kinase [Clostridiales bacterium]
MKNKDSSPKNTKKKKRSSKNLKINTRIIISSVLGIIVPIVIIMTFFTICISQNISFFGLSSTATNTYGIINQIRWSQTLSTIADELSSDESEQEKKEYISDFSSNLEDLGYNIYIECDGAVFYSATDENIIEKANSIVEINDISQNINYFGQNGMVIVNHAQSGSKNYNIIILNDEYTVNDASEKLNAQNIKSLILSQTGIIIFFITVVFILSIIILSLITSKTIVAPIRKIAKGANEIARGNLDYNIDFESTNELGKTVDAFNEMRIRLKESIEKQTKAEDERKILVAGIAHDLRTPLTSAKGYAEGILDGIADTDEKKLKYLQTICTSIDETEKILNDLSTISRLELRNFELNKTDVSVNEFLADGAQEIGLILEREGFDFSYDSNCSNDTKISIDTDIFARVISNIISNSIKYKRENVKGKVEISLNEYEKNIIIEISYNCSGVERNNLPKIFDTMYRTDPARTKVSQGSGLGLSICKQIVELHGGTIWASTSHDDGLSILISLPKKENDINEQNSDN